jgi:hypothetical protein
MLAAATAALEELHGALVFLGRCTRGERSEVSTPAGLSVLLSRIKTIFAGFELSDHSVNSLSC